MKKKKNNLKIHTIKRVSLLMLLAVICVSVFNVRGSDGKNVSDLDLNREYEKSKNDEESYMKTASIFAQEIININNNLIAEATKIEDVAKEVADYEKQIEDLEQENVKLEDLILTTKDEIYNSIRMMYEGEEDRKIILLLLKSESFLDFLNVQEYINDIESNLEELIESYSDMFSLQEERLIALSELEEKKAEKENELNDLRVDKGGMEIKIEELTELVNAAKKNAKNAKAFSERLSIEIDLMEARERSLLEHKAYDGSVSQVEYQEGTTGTDYYYKDPYEYTDSELTLLAAMIEAEAGSVSYPGMIAVGSVIMNRVQSDRFPNTIEGVIYAPYQFEPAHTGRHAVIMARGPASSCFKAARDVLAGKRNIPNFYFKAAWYAKEHGINGINIGGNVFH